MLQLDFFSIAQLSELLRVLLIFISSVLALRVGKFPLASWLTTRNPDQLSFIDKELKRPAGLSPAMQTHLKQKREALLFRATERIAVSAHTAREMIAVSEDYPGGIRWSTLKLAGPYLTLNERGKLTVKISKWEWAFGLITASGAVGCLLMVILIGLLLQYTVKATTLAVGFALIVWSGVGMIFLLHPLTQILAARHVAQRLLDYPSGRTSPGEIREGTDDTETLTAGERNTKIAGVGGREGRQIGGMAGQIKEAVGGSVGDIDMDASYDRIADLAVYSADRKLQLIAEIKSKRAAEAWWAADLRHHIFLGDALPKDTPFFLVATPDRFFLWKQPASTPGTDENPTPPDYTVYAQPFMSSHLDYTRQDTSDAGHRKITKGELTIALVSWFTRLSYSESVRNDLTDHAPWVFESGLFDAVRGGRVEFNTPV